MHNYRGDRTDMGLCELLWSIRLMPINDEDRYDAHISSTGVQLC